jgi:hypothetical protein
MPGVSVLHVPERLGALLHIALLRIALLRVALLHVGLLQPIRQG